jgi:2,3-bisphosphoglycerate-independent phosphoglycerate mutase
MTEKLHVLAESVRTAYQDGEEDEQLLPRVLVDKDGKPIGRIADKDIVIFYDIRGEREIQLTQCFIEKDFPHFDVKGRAARFTTMIEYHSSLDVGVGFPPEVELKGTLGDALQGAGKTFSKVVETEKAIHLAYFLNGKKEEPFDNEKRISIESPKDVANYDERPHMAAREVVAKVIEQIEGDTDVIIVNFANVDVVAHIEVEKAVIEAVEAADRALGAVLAGAENAGIPVIVTADHGTAEKWYYPDGTFDTGHTDSPVPFVLVDENNHELKMKPGGALTDVAPTFLSLLGIDKPTEMTGQNLITEPDKIKTSERAMLIIMDGWGHNEDDFGNLIMKADTPVMDSICFDYPFTTLEASGEAVGMPKGKVGNSESGHLHIGAGRLVPSDRIKIDASIKDGSYRKNEAFLKAMETARDEGRPLHFLGIVSFYSSHGSVDHLYELLEMAKEVGVKEVYHHGLLGRRGERPEAGARYIDDVESYCEKIGLGKAVTVMGRFWALDREENWDRVEKAYRAIADGEGIKVIDNK